jgi:cysteine dioxygenase
VAKTLQQLFEYLDNLKQRAPLAELVAEMSELQLDCAEVAGYVRFSDQGYARNLMRSGDWYYALILCWKNGQRSPIHNHAGSSCGVRVLRGTLTETQFQFAVNGHVKAIVSHDFSPGSVIGSEDRDMHQISNLQAGDADLVTLHVYSPPLVSMETYSITDRSRGQEWMLLEFSDAAGI